MQFYRLVPVGDKIVLIIEPNERSLAGLEADYLPMRDVKASCYDFGIERFCENEPFNQITTSIGGNSHE